MMSTVVSPERKRLHPHKFTMWVAIGAIIMMFSGLTSAYIVRSNQNNWLEFTLPPVFWYSTAVILFSSLTMYLAVKAYRAREMARYKTLITITALLGLLFGACQFWGFIYLDSHGVQLIGQGSNPAASFIAVIAGLHVIHVLGGVTALLVLFIRAYSSKVKRYNVTGIEIAATYWHFVDILWIYLFIFFKMAS
ncbi:MAG TPA: cytochrome c oxidase subunit 3 [Chitinophagaceae bacterium]|nr:cytochrome c oxidase subunit 3 [Chitinophagaceae bacterium]